MEWQPIETAPKDGRLVLLAGGETDESDYMGEVGSLLRRPVVALWRIDGWVFAYWDGGWRNEYLNPTCWAPLETQAGDPRTRATTPHPPDTPEEGA